MATPSLLLLCFLLSTTGPSEDDEVEVEDEPIFNAVTEGCLLPLRTSSLYLEQGSPCQLRKWRPPRKAEVAPSGRTSQGWSLMAAPDKFRILTINELSLVFWKMQKLEI